MDMLGQPEVDMSALGDGQLVDALLGSMMDEEIIDDSIPADDEGMPLSAAVAALTVPEDEPAVDLAADLGLDDLAAELGLTGEEPDAEPVAAAANVDATDIEQAARDADMQDAKQELYNEQESDATPDAALAPLPNADDVAAEPKKKREAKKKEPKEPRPTSVTHKPGDLMMAKLGENARDFLVFDMSDVELDADALTAKQDAFVERMNDPNAIADKVREKAVMLLTWMKTGGKMNEVMRRAFTVLVNDGQLTSGDKGNLQQNLLAKPYSLGTARSQANQMFMLFPELGITKKEKGRMVPNENSTILMKVRGALEAQ